MNRFTRFTKPLLALGLALVFFIVIGLVVALQPDQQSSFTLALSRPPFLQAAQASTGGTDAFEIGEKLDDEAGISAWFKTDGPIDLGLVKNALRTVEIEAPTYIVGSVDVPEYPEVFDAHIYVHIDGWFLAYYLRADIPAKVIDTRAKTIQSSILESALSVVAGSAGAPFSSGTHYDFRYPNATKMLLIEENYSDGNCFTIQIPSEYGYFDRGYAVYDTWPDENQFFIDGEQLPFVYASGNPYYIAYGTISSSQLLPDTTYNVCVDANDDAWGVLMILYREP